MYEGETDLNTQATTSCNSLLATQSVSNRRHSSTTSTAHVDLDILRASMTGDASQVCVFGAGLYEAKPRRKATFRIDASQAGLLINIDEFSSYRSLI